MIVYKKKDKDKKQQRYHCWAAVGWIFKSELVFYEVPGNRNGKMSQRVSLTLFLSRLWNLGWSGRRSCVGRGWRFGAWVGKNSIVRDWKNEHNLKCCFVLILQISLLLRTVGKSQTKLWEGSHIGMMRLQLMQSSRNGRISLRKKLMRG